MTMTIQRLFNGDVMSAWVARVTTAAGLARAIEAARSGDGWGVRVLASTATVEALGGYETIYGEGVIPCLTAREGRIIVTLAE